MTPAPTKIRPRVIKTARFTLRPLRAGDLPLMAKLINNRAIARNLLSVPHPYKMADAREWFRRIRNNRRRKNPTWINFVIEIDGQFAGDIGLFRFAGHKAELGYWLAKSYWGLGIMTAVVKEVVKFGFRELGLRRIYAHVFIFNKASARVLEKAGFKFEGRLAKNVRKGDRLLDEYLFARVR
jgi:RimJ/RimL family protein N-acetyltransferase